MYPQQPATPPYVPPVTIRTMKSTKPEISRRAAHIVVALAAVVSVATFLVFATQQLNATQPTTTEVVQ